MGDKDVNSQGMPNVWAAFRQASTGEPPVCGMIWDTLWVDAHVATMREGDGPYGAIEDGAIAVVDGRIAFVGPRQALPAGEEAARVVHRCAGRWLLPGLVDSHTHLVFAGTRALDFEMRLEGADRAALYAAGRGIPATVRDTRAASFDDLLTSTLDRLDRLMAEGVTTVEIKSGYGLDLDTELKQLRVARAVAERRPATVLTSFLGMHGLPPEHEGPAATYVDFVCNVSLPAAVEEGLVDIVDGGLERICFSHEEMSKVWEKATALGKPIKSHADQYADADGAATVARFNGLSADHLECVSIRGVEAMAKAGTVATMLPGANHMLRDPNRPPVAAFRSHGVPMALATNANPGSSPTLSPLLMMNLAAIRFDMTPAEAVAGFTRNGARALGLGDTHGTLEVGKVADFSEWRIERPAELAYWLGGPKLCTRVVKGGAVVVQNGAPMA